MKNENENDEKNAYNEMIYAIPMKQKNILNYFQFLRRDHVDQLQIFDETHV